MPDSPNRSIHDGCRLAHERHAGPAAFNTGDVCHVGRVRRESQTSLRDCDKGRTFRSVYNRTPGPAMFDDVSIPSRIRREEYSAGGKALVRSAHNQAIDDGVPTVSSAGCICDSMRVGADDGAALSDVVPSFMILFVEYDEHLT